MPLSRIRRDSSFPLPQAAPLLLTLSSFTCHSSPGGSRLPCAPSAAARAVAPPAVDEDGCIPSPRSHRRTNLKSMTPSSDGLRGESFLGAKRRVSRSPRRWEQSSRLSSQEAPLHPSYDSYMPSIIKNEREVDRIAASVLWPRVDPLTGHDGKRPNRRLVKRVDPLPLP